MNKINDILKQQGRKQKWLAEQIGTKKVMGKNKGMAYKNQKEKVAEIPENIEITFKEESGHKCPYCGRLSMLINEHFNHIKWAHPNKPLEKSGHKCPYCGKLSMLINEHFNHIKWMHPNKPLI